MRVGTSNKIITAWTKQEDHPHACGDKMLTKLPVKSVPGSSPCVWGQVKFHRKNRYDYGIIPMRVGTSDTCALCVKKFQDHPHACGDKSLEKLFKLTDTGSSPCVWGQGVLTLTAQDNAGIIPMRVGTRTVLAPPILCRQDHPHACGDKAMP